MTLRLGLLGVSRIAEGAVIAPAAKIEGVAVAAVASRSPSRAQDAAERWGIPKWYSSYESLLASPEIDAVYISTPTSLHRPWTVAAVQHSKHVLCEKPIASNADDARLVATTAAGSGLVVMEAMHWRYHPMVDQMRRVLDSGQLGRVVSAEASFLVPGHAVPPDDIRWELKLGGGAMMDIGIYPSSWLRWAVGGEPTVVAATADCPVAGVDGRMQVDLVWPTGITGRIECSMVLPEPDMSAEIVVTGSRGRLTAINPIAPHGGARIVVEDDNGITTLPVSTEPTYTYQLEAFRDAVLSGAPVLTDVDDAIATMTLVDACYRAAGLEPRPSHR